MKTTEADVAERLRRQQEALAEFGLRAFRARDLDELLNRAAELVAEGLKVRRAKVLELLPGGNELLVRAGVNWNPGVVGHVRFGAGKDSPAGFALRRHEPVVSPDLDQEKRFKIPDVLIEHGIKSMVNVIIAGDSGPFGVLEVDAEEKRGFTGHDIAFLRNYANLLAVALERHRSQEKLSAALHSQSVLVQELEHRVKNMLSLVQSLANQTVADEPAARAFREAFLGRLKALARAESLLFGDHGQEIELELLVRQSVDPFRRSRAGAVVAEGPPLRLPARHGRTLALVLHELGTNATKHGALSVPEGRVHIHWQTENGAQERKVRLRWREEGGLTTAPPKRRGFGTKLLTRLAAYELNGTAELKHAAEGLSYEIAFPVDE